MEVIVADLPLPCCEYASFLGIISNMPIAAVRVHELRDDADDVSYDDIVYGSPVSGQRTQIENFVTRFYHQCLNREPDIPELNSWVDALLNGSHTGADVAQSFIFSQEFINRNTTNEEFVKIMYGAFFGRESDSVGFNGWLSALNSGTSREDALNGFIYSQEFENLCNSYGIIPYSDYEPPEDGTTTQDLDGDGYSVLSRFALGLVGDL